MTSKRKHKHVVSFPIQRRILTWLNGRMPHLEVLHEGRYTTIWRASDGISIEDAVLGFCERLDIDMAKEAGEES